MASHAQTRTQLRRALGHDGRAVGSGSSAPVGPSTRSRRIRRCMSATRDTFRSTVRIGVAWHCRKIRGKRRASRQSRGQSNVKTEQESLFRRRPHSTVASQLNLSLDGSSSSRMTTRSRPVRHPMSLHRSAIAGDVAGARISAWSGGRCARGIIFNFSYAYTGTHISRGSSWPMIRRSRVHRAALDHARRQSNVHGVRGCEHRWHHFLLFGGFDWGSWLSARIRQ